MKQDKTYQLLVARMQEISSIPPQTIGPFTPVYKRIIPKFKYYPLKNLFIISLTAAFLMYFLFGPSIVKLASLLQIGF